MSDGFAEETLRECWPGEGPTIAEVPDSALLQTVEDYSPPSTREDLSLLSATVKELERRGYDPTEVASSDNVIPRDECANLDCEQAPTKKVTAVLDDLGEIVHYVCPEHRDYVAEKAVIVGEEVLDS